MANDGGIYSRSLAKAKKWINNNADLRMLQYYYGGIGQGDGRHGVLGRPAGQRRLPATAGRRHDGLAIRR